MPDSLSITDNRTGKTIEVSVDGHGAFPASELKKLGLLSFDQPLLATATARSAITFLDGEAGILRYRGYPIEQLAEKTSFLEVAYLLAYGELPTAAQRSVFEAAVLGAQVDTARIRKHVESFPAGSHPMSVLISGYAALGAAHQEAKAAVHDGEARKAALPTQLAETLHKRLWEENIPVLPVGQYQQPFLWRKNITGIMKANTVVYWNIEKN